MKTETAETFQLSADGMKEMTIETPGRKSVQEDVSYPLEVLHVRRKLVLDDMSYSV